MHFGTSEWIPANAYFGPVLAQVQVCKEFRLLGSLSLFLQNKTNPQKRFFLFSFLLLFCRRGSSQRAVRTWTLTFRLSCTVLMVP